MDIEFYPLVIAAGVLAGFINTLAGSGSLITLPLLMFLGLPVHVANGTNRVAILLQSVVAVRGFARSGHLAPREAVPLLIPAMIGAVVGALIAADLNERMMRMAIAVVMVLMLIVILFKPKRWLAGADSSQRLDHRWSWPLLFAVGVYGGFIQAGVGIFLLAALVLGSGLDLVRGNGVKNLVVLCFTPLALGVFVWKGQVDWSVGLVLALGNMIGAWLGVKAADRGGAGFVRWVLIVVVAASATKLIWDLI